MFLNIMALIIAVSLFFNLINNIIESIQRRKTRDSNSNFQETFIRNFTIMGEMIDSERREREKQIKELMDMLNRTVKE